MAEEAAVLDTPELISQTRAKFEARLEELRPQVDEFHQIADTLAILKGERAAGTRRRGTTATATRAERGARPKEFLSLVEAHPGITLNEAFEQMDGVQKNYLYRIAGDMVKEGRIVKDEATKGFSLA